MASPVDKEPNKKNHLGIWGLVVAVLAAIGTFLTVPEFRRIIGWSPDTSAVALKEVELITHTETGEALPGVKVQVVGSGAPETHYTDSHGYLKVNIASKGNVRVTLSIAGYPTQNFVLNLENDQKTVRTIRLAQSGQPEVTSQTSPPPNLVPSPSPTLLTNLPDTSISSETSIIYEDDIIRAEVLGASFNSSGQLQTSLSIDNKTSQDLLLALEPNYPTVISNVGESGSCFISGLKANVGTTSSNPTLYSRLKPNQNLTVSLSGCNKPTASSKPKSFSISMPLVRLINDKPSTPFTLDISNIPIQQ
jgi:hypothetical protein